MTATHSIRLGVMGISCTTTSAALLLALIAFFVKEKGKTVAQFSLVPFNTSACLNNFATFICRSQAPTSRLFFYVNGTPVAALPRYFKAMSYGTDERTLQFHILALKETNRSVITCGIDVSGIISDFTMPVFLTVFRSPSPPTNLSVAFTTSTSVLNITWTLPTEDCKPCTALYYTVRVIDIIDNSTISRYDTVNQHFTYDVTMLRSYYGIDLSSYCRILPNVYFSVSVTYAVSALLPCPRSEESTATGISNICSVLGLGNYSYHNQSVNAGYTSQVCGAGLQAVSTCLVSLILSISLS